MLLATAGFLYSGCGEPSTAPQKPLRLPEGTAKSREFHRFFWEYYRTALSVDIELAKSADMGRRLGQIAPGFEYKRDMCRPTLLTLGSVSHDLYKRDASGDYSASASDHSVRKCKAHVLEPQDPSIPSTADRRRQVAIFAARKAFYKSMEDDFTFLPLVPAYSDTIEFNDANFPKICKPMIYVELHIQNPLGWSFVGTCASVESKRISQKQFASLTAGAIELLGRLHEVGFYISFSAESFVLYPTREVALRGPFHVDAIHPEDSLVSYSDYISGSESAIGVTNPKVSSNFPVPAKPRIDNLIHLGKLAKENAKNCEGGEDKEYLKIVDEFLDALTAATNDKPEYAFWAKRFHEALSA